VDDARHRHLNREAPRRQRRALPARCATTARATCTLATSDTTGESGRHGVRSSYAGYAACTKYTDMDRLASHSTRVVMDDTGRVSRTCHSELSRQELTRAQLPHNARPLRQRLVTAQNRPSCSAGLRRRPAHCWLLLHRAAVLCVSQ
jgi:hypothetical protein